MLGFGLTALRNLFMKVIELKEEDNLYFYTEEVLGFLFLEKKHGYSSDISGVLEDLISDLNQKQKNRLLDVFLSCKDTAKQYGFYNEFIPIIQQIHEQTKGIFSKTIEFIGRRIFFITLMILFIYEHQKGYPVNPYLFYTIPLFGSFILRTILNVSEYFQEKFSFINSEIAGLNDFLVSTHRKNDQDEAFKKCMDLLIKENWINKDGEIILEEQKNKVA